MEDKNGLMNRLPDIILVEILSQLPLKTAIATAVLSRRWRWLWTHITNVDIDVRNYPANSAYFYVWPPSVIKQLSFVNDNVLPKLTSPIFRSLSLHLHYDDRYLIQQFDGKEDEDFDDKVSWYDWACRHRNRLQKLRVILARCSGPTPDTPLWIFQIPSLVVLELVPLWYMDNYDDKDNEYRNLSFHLPNLKKVCVRLHSRCIWILEKLVLSSPCLEILSCTIDLSIPTDIVNLSSRNLKQLEMRLLEKPNHVVIDAPKLETLRFHAYENTQSNKISFVNSIPALLNCSILPLRDYWGNDIFLPSNLCDVISGVKSLNTTAHNPTSLTTSITFRYLTHLQLRVCWGSGKLGSLYLLQRCPVLEVLSFDISEYVFPTTNCKYWSLPESAPQCLVTCVKRIEILACRSLGQFEDILFQLLNYLLGNAEALELLKVTITSPCSTTYDEIRFIKQLFKVPRTSSQSRVEFYSPNQTVLGDVCIDRLAS